MRMPSVPVACVGTVGRVGNLAYHVEPGDRLDDIGLGAPEERIVDAERVAGHACQQIAEERERLRMRRARRAGALRWTCPAFLESVQLTSRAFRSKAMGLWKPSDECRLTG